MLGTGPTPGRCPVLDGRLAAGFASIFGRFYTDGYLRRHVSTDNGKGGVTREFAEFPVKLQVDRAGQLRQSPGYEEGDARIIILAHGIDRVQADDELVEGVNVWRLSAPETDPLKSHWIARGRLKP
jgi:hypothetical protein